MIDRRILACAIASVVAHATIARALEELPPREVTKPPSRIEVRMIAPPEPSPEVPPPEPPRPPDPPPPEPPPPRVHEAPRVKQVAKVVREVEPPPSDPPPVENAVTTTDGTATPRFGVTMESTSQGGKMAVPVGNTTRPTPAGPPEPVQKPLAAPAAAHEVTKMPLPQGRCAGAYTDAAREAALEGVVVLDVIVDETGRTRSIEVVERLGHGLTEAAITALRTCRFTPGEKDGAAVAVRVRGFKIRFLLDSP